MAVCGQPPVSTPMMRSSGSACRRARIMRIFLGVDVVGDDRDRVVVAHRLAELLGQRGLAGADRTADADAKRTVH